MPLTFRTRYALPPRIRANASSLLARALVACAALLALSGCRGQGPTSASVAAAAPAAQQFSAPGAERESARAEEEPAVNQQPLKLPLNSPKLVIEKEARRLTLFSGGEAVRTYTVVLGFAPVGDKEKQGDGRTPEGTFYVCVRNDKSNFYLSLGLSYPNAEDAARGLRDGLITQKQHDRIARAIRRRSTPPWDTPLGGEIFIHGGGTGSDWTAGCVALENPHMKELFDAVPLGATVVIEP